MTQLATGVDSKVIFIGGLPNSGKTLLGRLLEGHADIAFFDSRTKFVSDRIFQNFSTWIIACPDNNKDELVDIFKSLFMTRYFSMYRDSWVKPFGLALWKRMDLFWQRRFTQPQSLFWSSPVGKVYDRFWRMTQVQSRSFALKLQYEVEGQIKKPMPFGLHVRFSREQVQDSLNILDALKSVKHKSEAMHILQCWWKSLFASYGIQKNKKHWADERPGYMQCSDFLSECFTDLKIIHVMRDPRDSASINCVEATHRSRRQVKVRGHANDFETWKNIFEKTMIKTKRLVQKESQLPTGTCLRVRYEDLVFSTEKTLKEVCAFLGLPFDHHMMAYQVRQDESETCQRILKPSMRQHSIDHYSHELLQWGYAL